MVVSGSFRASRTLDSRSWAYPKRSLILFFRLLAANADPLSINSSHNFIERTGA
jgi:hypothetical protein